MPPGVTALTVEHPAAHWASPTFHRLHPAIPLPSPRPDTADVEVWISLPAGTAATVDDGAIAWPPGTTADRVEWAGTGDGRYVVDVRGTTLDAGGAPLDHLMRPARRQAGAPLLGVQWPAHDTEARAAAVDHLLDLLERSDPKRAEAPRRDKLRAGLHRKANCTDCHVPRRETNTTRSEHGLVHRGTDANGWFTPQSVLATSLPVEAYGKTSLAAASPFLTRSCGEGADRPCAEAEVPMATLDVRAATAASDPHTQAWCASRAWLVSRVAGLSDEDPCAQP